MQLLYLGIKIPHNLDTPKWTHDFRQWVREVKCFFPTGEQMLASMMDQYDFIEAQIRKVSNLLRAY